MHKEIIFLTLFVRSRAKTSLKDDSPVEEEDDEEEEAKEEGEKEEEEEEDVMGLWNEGQEMGIAEPRFGFLDINTEKKIDFEIRIHFVNAHCIATR